MKEEYNKGIMHTLLFWGVCRVELKSFQSSIYSIVSKYFSGKAILINHINHYLQQILSTEC